MLIMKRLITLSMITMMIIIIMKIIYNNYNKIWHDLFLITMPIIVLMIGYT